MCRDVDLITTQLPLNPKNLQASIAKRGATLQPVNYFQVSEITPGELPRNR